jgi:hypothetical protein
VSLTGNVEGKLGESYTMMPSSGLSGYENWLLVSRYWITLPREDPWETPHEMFIVE